jgi:hypothetical protein
MEHAHAGFPSGDRALKALWRPDDANPGQGGRLTLTSGTPVTTSDVTSATAIYYEPFTSNRITLLDANGVPRVYEFERTTLPLGTLTSGKNYDVFGMMQNKRLRLEIGTAWTSDTARAEALAQTRGLYHRNADKRKLYLGTFRTTSTTTTEDSNAKRFLWNAFNRVTRKLRVTDSTDNWNYTLVAFQQARASTANQVACVAGLAGTSLVDIVCCGHSRNSTGGTSVGMFTGIGVDSSTVNSADVQPLAQSAVAGIIIQGIAKLSDYVALGYHEYRWLEASTATGTTTWLGDNGGNCASGISGVLSA